MTSVMAASGASVQEIFGDADPLAVIGAVSRSPSPARLLARAAPLLTSAAEHGEQWAADLLEQEMATLAATAARHIREHVPAPVPALTLSGGVWASRAAEAVFTAAARRLHPSPLIVTRSRSDPIEGAVCLAQSMASEHRASAH